MANKMKWLWGTLAGLTGVGGLVHALQPLGMNILDALTKGAGVVQFIAGASTVAFVAYYFVKLKR